MKQIASILLLLLLLAGCQSTPPSGSAGAEPADTSGPNRSTSTAPSSAKSLVDIMDGTVPTDGVPTFLGIAQRRRDRSEEEAVALLHVADQVARYLQISGQYQIDFDSAGRTTLVKENILTDWNPERGQSLTDSFEVTDVYQDNDNTYVLARVPSLKAAPVIPGLSTGRNKPAWVDTPPTLPGYIVSVGITQRRRVVKDSIDFADEDALKGIIMTMLSQVDAAFWSRSVEQQGETTGSTSSTITGTGSLTGFYVLSRWISPDMSYYYSLAVAPVQ